MGGDSFLRSKLSLLHKFERISIIQIFWKREEVFFFLIELWEIKIFFVLLTVPKVLFNWCRNPFVPYSTTEKKLSGLFYFDDCRFPLKWPYVEHPLVGAHPHVPHSSHWARAVTSVKCEEL